MGVQFASYDCLQGRLLIWDCRGERGERWLQVVLAGIRSCWRVAGHNGGFNLHSFTSFPFYFGSWCRVDRGVLGMKDRCYGIRSTRDNRVFSTLLIVDSLTQPSHLLVLKRRNHSFQLHKTNICFLINKSAILGFLIHC